MTQTTSEVLFNQMTLREQGATLWGGGFRCLPAADRPGIGKLKATDGARGGGALTGGGRFVVMGVSGCGKSLIGARLAAATAGTFIDGDDLHPAANIAKMSRGEPLTDDDRAPWLDQVGAALAAAAGEAPVIIACSALKRRYRDRIGRGAGGAVTYLYLRGQRATLLDRVSHRPGHFMPPSLLDSQLAALEEPTGDEAFAVADIEAAPDDIVARIMAATGLHLR